MAYVPPSKSTPAALRKARWERDQQVLAAARAAAQAKVAAATINRPVAGVVKVSLAKKPLV